MMITEPFENLYFNWLCAKVIYNMNPTPSLTYWNLLRTLHNTEFVWLLSGDDNRAADGLELRRDFIFEAEAPDHPDWRKHPGCSMLEMLIAFSRRAEHMTGEKAQEWFWEMIDNLGLKEVNDGHEATPEDIGEILDEFIWRTYEPNGQGGLFPLINPKRDQTEVEIWYQFAEYLVDQCRL
jgi:hypothetical protein